MFLPRKSLSLTVPPALAVPFQVTERSVKSGAMSPTFNCVLGGCCGCANNPALSIAPIAMTFRALKRNPSQGDFRLSHQARLFPFQVFDDDLPVGNFDLLGHVVVLLERELNLRHLVVLRQKE